MNELPCSAFLVLVLLPLAAHAGPEPVLVVPASETTLHVASRVTVGTLKPGLLSSTLLVEEGAGGKPIPCDVIHAQAPDGSPDEKRFRLLVSIPPRPGATGTRRFKLLPAPGAARRKAFVVRDVNEKSVAIDEGLAPRPSVPVLVYNHGMISKKGVPARYNRACYIHPLHGLDGETLTEDFPSDHRHHRGVWWSWPHIRIDGKEYNSCVPTGIRYQHERWTLKKEGSAVGIVAAENGWYVGDTKVMREHVWIVVYRAVGNSRAIDIELTWTPIGKPIALWGAGGKSYGGLTFRYAPAKDRPKTGRRTDTVITVESGVTKRDLPNTGLKWADITGHAVGARGRSGCAVFCPTDHPDYPPTWLTRHYGPLCVGWPGVKPKTFEPGKPFRLRYRLWVHRGDADVKTLKAAYRAYTSLDEIKWVDARR